MMIMMSVCEGTIVCLILCVGTARGGRLLVCLGKSLGHQTCQPITLFPIKSQSCKRLRLVFWAINHFFWFVNYLQWMWFDCQSQKQSHGLPLSLQFFEFSHLCLLFLVAGGQILNFFKQIEKWGQVFLPLWQYKWYLSSLPNILIPKTYLRLASVIEIVSNQITNHVSFWFGIYDCNHIFESDFFTWLKSKNMSGWQVCRYFQVR